MGKNHDRPNLHIRHLRKISLGEFKNLNPPPRKENDLNKVREDVEGYDIPAIFDFQESDHKGPIKDMFEYMARNPPRGF